MISPRAPRALYAAFPPFADWVEFAVDTEQYDEYADAFGRAKGAASQRQVDVALEQAMRYAAVDTNAIEGIYETDRGFTRTVATQAESWQATMDARGDHVREAFSDALSGYKFVMESMAKSTPVSEMWIRSLHEVLCASQSTYQVYTSRGPEQRPLPKGTYKTMPNSPTLVDGRVHAYAPVEETPMEMFRLVEELRSPAFLDAHPVAQAAYAHYAYVCVHPFADGNGRVARALASAYLFRSPGVPLVVFADQRNLYFDALEAADGGDPSLFIHFVGARAIDSVGLMRVVLEQTAPPIEITLGRLGEIYNVSASSEELRLAALRLKSLAYSELNAQFERIPLPPQLSGIVNPLQVTAVQPDEDYLAIGKAGSFFAQMESSWPYSLRVIHNYSVGVRAGSSARSDLLLKSSAGDELEVSLREVDPVETEALRIKMASWVQGVLGRLLADVEAAARSGNS